MQILLNNKNKKMWNLYEKTSQSFPISGVAKKINVHNMNRDFFILYF